MDGVNINTLRDFSGSFHIYKLAFAWETPTYLHGRDVGVLQMCLYSCLPAYGTGDSVNESLLWRSPHGWVVSSCPRSSAPRLLLSGGMESTTR